MLIHLQRLLKSSAIYGLGTALNQTISILILPLFTNYLTPSDYGINSVLTILSAILSAFFSFGLGSSIGLVYYENNYENYKGRVIWNSLLTLFPGCIVLFFLATQSAFCSQFLFHTNIHSPLVYITILTVILNVLSMPLTLKMQFEDKGVHFIVISLIYTVLSLFLSAYFIVFFDMGVLGRVLGYGVGTLINFIILLLFSIKSFEFRLDFGLVKPLLKKGLPLIPSFFSLYVLQQGNIYMLKELASLNEVGLYSIGNTFGSSISLFVSSFITAWVPFALTFKQKPDSARELFGRILLYYLIAVSTFSLGLYVVAKPLVVFFTDDKFYLAYKIIGLSSTVQLLLGLFSILGIKSYFSGDISNFTYSQLISTVLFIPLSIILIHYLGIIGAILALVLAHIIMVFVMMYFNFKNRYKYILLNYDSAKNIFMILLYGTIAYLIYVFDLNIFDDFYLVISLAFLYFSLIYIFISTQKEREFLRDKWVLFKMWK